MSSATNWEWKKRAELSIAHGALTNSKRPSCFVEGVYPTHLARGFGAYLFDDRGQRYIDFICGLGANLFGYGNQEIARTVYDRYMNGPTLSLSTTLEVEAAEAAQSLFPCIERVRFLKTGSDACSASLKIARAATGRLKVLSAGYHGFHDEFVSLSSPALGVPPSPYIETLKNLDQISSAVAAVIVEPIVTDISNERVSYLHELRDRCSRSGAVLIFDEVITGFRFPRFSAASYFGIQPDLICLGKSLAGGLPLSVVGGNAAIMNCGEYFVSSTFAGETTALAAFLKTCELLIKKCDLAQLWEKGGSFVSRFNEIAPDLVSIEGYPTRGVFKASSDLTKAHFFQESVKAGILFGPSFFFGFQHMEMTDQVLATCRDIMIRIKTGMVDLEGQLPRSPFSQQMRDKA